MIMRAPAASEEPDPPFRPYSRVNDPVDSGPIRIECLVEAGDWPDALQLEQLAEKTVGAVLDELHFVNMAPSELSLLFTDDARIQQLNAKWRGQDRPTNVLSFPVTDLSPGMAPGPILGDVILAFETVDREARLENKPFGNHLTHLIVHGFLHLLGYDHQSETEGREMEALERRVLQRLAIPDPYGERQGDA